MWFGLCHRSLFDSSCCAVSQLCSSRGVAKSPALAYSLEESDQVKNNFKEFLKSVTYVFTVTNCCGAQMIFAANI